MPRSTSTCWGALPQPTLDVPVATMVHEPPPPCNTTVTGEKSAPGFATSFTAAQEESTAASRHWSTCAPSRAPDTPASIVARIAAPSAPHGSGSAWGVVVAVVVDGVVVVATVVVDADGFVVVGRVDEVVLDAESDDESSRVRSARAAPPATKASTTTSAMTRRR